MVDNKESVVDNITDKNASNVKKIKPGIGFFSILLLFFVVLLSFEIGVILGPRITNYLVFSNENWDITVQDTWKLHIGRDEKTDSKYTDVDHNITVIAPGPVVNHSVQSVEIHAAPSLFSDGARANGKRALQASVHDALLEEKSGKTNKGGYVSLSMTAMRVGKSMSNQSYVPPYLGLTFMVGDGLNPDGNFVFYEIKIHHGRYYSQSYLSEFTCDHSAIYETCVEKTIDKHVSVAVQEDYRDFSHSDITQSDTNSSELSYSMGGTKVLANVVLP